MIDKILKAIGASLFAAMFVLASSGGASAATVFPVYSDGSELDLGEEAKIANTNLAVGAFSDTATLKVGDVPGAEYHVDVEFSDGSPAGFYDLTLSINGGAGIAITDGNGLQIVDFLTSALISGTHATPADNVFVLSGVAFSSSSIEWPDYSIIIRAVPLPAAALLFGSALLGGGLLRRRKMIKDFGLPV